jgi:hypothetical protein
MRNSLFQRWRPSPQQMFCLLVGAMVLMDRDCHGQIEDTTAMVVFPAWDLENPKCRQNYRPKRHLCSCSRLAGYLWSLTGSWKLESIFFLKSTSKSFIVVKHLILARRKSARGRFMCAAYSAGKKSLGFWMGVGSDLFIAGLMNEIRGRPGMAVVC